MKELLKDGFVTEEGEHLSYVAVVDATHPYAVEVSENIRNSVETSAVSYLRLQRDGSAVSEYDNSEIKVKSFLNNKECALALTHTEENIALCEGLGIRGKQIIAMQGPFSKELNLALIKQFNICHLVTKQSGASGGFSEKIQAAQEAGICVWLIGSPKQEAGMTFHEVVQKLQSLTGILIMEQVTVEISLIGKGMGSSTMTVAARNALEHAILRLVQNGCLKLFLPERKHIRIIWQRILFRCCWKRKQKERVLGLQSCFPGIRDFTAGAKN